MTIPESSTKELKYSPLEFCDESGYQSRSLPPNDNVVHDKYTSLKSFSSDENWNRPLAEGSLPEFNGLIDVDDLEPNAPWWKKLFAYIGPGALVAVGYMDPGNWSTDIAGGSAYGYNFCLWFCCPQ